MIAPVIARQAAGIAGWLGPAALAVVHGLLFKGVLDRHPTAIAVSEYVFLWPIAEIISLLVTPYLMTLRVKDPDSPVWLRIVLFPAALLVTAGVTGALRIIEATWIYFLARVPTVLFERHTRMQASIGCARSMLAGTILVITMAVFANRPTDYPVGTIVGRELAPPLRELGNSMAMGMCYFALLAVADALIHRAIKKRGARNA